MVHRVVRDACDLRSRGGRQRRRQLGDPTPLVIDRAGRGNGGQHPVSDINSHRGGGGRGAGRGAPTSSVTGGNLIPSLGHGSVDTHQSASRNHCSRSGMLPGPLRGADSFSSSILRISDSAWFVVDHRSSSARPVEPEADKKVRTASKPTKDNHPPTSVGAPSMSASRSGTCSMPPDSIRWWMSSKAGLNSSGVSESSGRSMKNCQ